MRQILTLVLSVISLSLFAQEQVINDKNVVTRNVSGFSGIKVSNSIDLYLSQSNSEAVAVSASEEKYRDKIRTEVKNGILEIWYDQDKMSFHNNENKKLKAYVSFKTISRLIASGASDIYVNGVINTENLKLSVSGASDFKGKVKITNLDISMSGASDVKIDGSASNLKIDASGASDLKGYNLTADNCTVEASGASDINITANNSLSVQASGASSIRYKGSAQVKNVSTSGASSIRKA